MKFCIHCGEKLEDGMRFCANCGAPVEEPGAAPAPAFEGKLEAEPVETVAECSASVQQPAEPKKKKSRKPLVLGIAAAVLVVIALVILLATGAFLGDQGKVAAAFIKTAGAYTEAVGNLNLDPSATADLMRGQEYNQSMEVELKAVPGYAELSGLGARLDMSYSLKDKNIDMVLTPFFGSADIVDVQMKIADDMLYLGAPDVVGDTVFAVNTETLGQDLYAMGAVEEDTASLRLNVFELLQMLEEYNRKMQEKQKIPTEKLKAILETVEVEKVGKTTTEVNGRDVKCTEYAVVIPQNALEELLSVYEEVYDTADTQDLMMELMRSIGVPDDALEEMAYSFENTEDVFADVKELINEIGDVECSVFVNKGYVMAVTGMLSAYGSDLEYQIQLGGGDNYVDDIGIYLEADGGEVQIVSTGDHGAKNGMFTDETVIKLSGEKIEIETSYDPKAAEENFEMHVSAVDTVDLDIVGLIRMDKNGCTVDLDKLSLTVDGESLSVGVRYTVGDYEAYSMTTAGALEVLKMSEDALMAEMEAVAVKAMAWAENFAAENGQLMEILGYMM